VVRLQKFLADAGIASRRAAEQIILDGKVRVNGRPVRLLGTKVDPVHDEVSVDGKPIRAKRSFTSRCTSRRAASVRTPTSWAARRFINFCQRNGKSSIPSAAWISTAKD
jgi:ribosomal protein S4